MPELGFHPMRGISKCFEVAIIVSINSSTLTRRREPSITLSAPTGFCRRYRAIVIGTEPVNAKRFVSSGGRTELVHMYSADLLPKGFRIEPPVFQLASYWMRFDRRHVNWVNYLRIAVMLALTFALRYLVLHRICANLAVS